MASKYQAYNDAVAIATAYAGSDGASAAAVPELLQDVYDKLVALDASAGGAVVSGGMH